MNTVRALTCGLSAFLAVTSNGRAGAQPLAQVDQWEWNLSTAILSVVGNFESVRGAQDIIRTNGDTIYTTSLSFIPGRLCSLSAGPARVLTCPMSDTLSPSAARARWSTLAARFAEMGPPEFRSTDSAHYYNRDSTLVEVGIEPSTAGDRAWVFIRVAGADPPRFELTDQCLIMYLRRARRTAALSPHLCKQVDAPLVGTHLFGKMYGGWASELHYAFDLAESAICDSVGCTTGDRPLWIAVTAKGFPSALTYDAGDAGLTMIMTGGLFDYAVMVQQAFASDLIDLVHNRPGGRIASFFARIRAAGGHNCAEPIYVAPIPTDSEQRDSLFVQLTYNARLSLTQFVFAHELAHIHDGANCGYPGRDTLGIELACDKIAFQRLMKKGMLAPNSPILALIAMGYWEASRAAQIVRVNVADAPGTLRQAFPARAWPARAQQLLSLWQDLCDAEPGSRSCAPPVEQKLQNLATLAEPQPCIDPVQRPHE